MLNEKGIDFHYREYTEEPLTGEEIKALLEKLQVGASELLRTRDPAYKEAGLSTDGPEDRLISKMAQFPTLIQRPIGVLGDRAVIGRPVETLLDLVK